MHFKMFSAKCQLFCSGLKCFNSVWPSNAIWRSWSTLVQVWLDALRHQAITRTNDDLPSTSSSGIYYRVMFTWDVSSQFIFEIDTFEIPARPLRGQWVKNTWRICHSPVCKEIIYCLWGNWNPSVTAELPVVMLLAVSLVILHVNCAVIVLKANFLLL